jgi:hypothetical protein
MWGSWSAYRAFLRLEKTNAPVIPRGASNNPGNIDYNKRNERQRQLASDPSRRATIYPLRRQRERHSLIGKLLINQHAFWA